MDLQLIIMIVGLAGAIILGGMAFMGPSTGKAGNRRIKAIRTRYSDSADSVVEKQLKKAMASRRPTAQFGAQGSGFVKQIAVRLTQTGKDITMKKYMQASIGLCVVAIAMPIVLGASPLLAIFVGFLIGFGIPYFYVGTLIKKRQKLFISNFPDAIDLLVRGLRSGLPVSETLGIVSKELRGPVAEEFKMITERMKIGRTMDDALAETALRMNTPEFNFFCITLAIQRETGGNLSETLNNLGGVLRGRAAMALKVKAMSSEGKASAMIVGALPFVVFGLIFYINPDYIGQFFIDDRLIATGLGALVWMGIGVAIMKKMINFEI